MSPQSLGEVFQRSIASTGPRVESPLASPTTPRSRPAFVYRLGGLGGLIGALGFFLIYMYVVAPEAPWAHGEVIAAACLVALGELALASACVLLLGARGHVGASALVASLAAVFAIV